VPPAVPVRAAVQRRAQVNLDLVFRLAVPPANRQHDEFLSPGSRLF
jgi:hypothetical protein